MPSDSLSVAGTRVRAGAATNGSRPLAGAAVVSVGVAVPERVVANVAIAERLGVSAEWIETRTGIRERRFAGPGEGLTELSALAGERALAGAGIDAAALDLVLVATFTADRRLPHAAPLVAERLGAKRVGAIDISAACTGFLSALGLAVGQVEAGRAGPVLVIGADVMSPVTDPNDKRTAGLFADGAGAVVVVPSTGAGRVGAVVLGSDGSASELVTLDATDGFIHMNGHDTFRHAVASLSDATLAALDRDGLQVADVDLYVYHQANGRILRAVGDQLGLESAQVADYISRFGNTSSASIPIAMAEAEAEGRLWPGARVLLAAFGSGLTWGALTLKWGVGDVA